MAGLQVAPLLRSRRRPPRPDLSGGSASGSWCCKLAILAVLAFLALLTTFESTRAFSTMIRRPAESSGALDATIGKIGASIGEHVTSLETTTGKTEASVSEQAMSTEEVQSSSRQETSTSESSSGSGSCRGIESWELWGPATLAGDKNKQASAEACCGSCREMCKTKGLCHCDSWVYCGNEAECKEHFQECWLKKQQDELKPDIRLGAGKVPWTSGMIYATGMGVVALETAHGKIRIQLAPDLAPRTVDYVRSVLALKFCSGCQFYRAEGLGAGWSKDGKRTEAPPGPPYALLQGSLQADGLAFEEIPMEGATVAVRGTVCLIGGGPEFFISVGDHVEWDTAHTVFGHVIPEDMPVVDTLVALPTRKDVWGQTEVQVLESPVQFALKRAVPVS
ncbi:peptidyl-prolyl cis-trans isomerases [Klebsormidium nitens]|uniref:Peptidyl-prolyl cis-trans isomerases n=1 Tax=Klebsormidium nitens TaxID=105231 RepID=A0A1Y1HLQ7_KLENI|nr:peptidyl-prolyl cis-trans isomerases [Klebsormidium nitens]|eukprot:GAQ78099.1 peptidyl-prolyl cis-trans isomerases [Klebsormidium nitens]